MALDYQELVRSLEHVCVLVTITYFLARTRGFSRLLGSISTRNERVLGFAFFSLLVVIEVALSQMGNSLSTRTVNATAAGLLGGPIVGLGVGAVTVVASLIAGSGAYAAGTAAVVGGLMGGWIGIYRPSLTQKTVAGFLVGSLSYALLMSILTYTDFREAASWDALLLQYGPPVFASGAAVALFVTILADMRAHQERIERNELGRAIRTVTTGIPKLEKGLGRDTASRIAETVRRLTGVDAVCVVGRDSTVGYAGAGADHHSESWSHAALACISEGKPLHFDRASGMLCNRPDCRLSEVWVRPMHHGNEVVGCVEVFRANGHGPTKEVVDLCSDITQFFCSYHLQLAELHAQTQATAKAELKALQAQVHPHFLFNTLNTIAALCEIDPRRAGDLIVRLGEFFRSSLRSDSSMVTTVEGELGLVRSYLEIEKARFGDRLEIVEDCDPSAAGCAVPTFTLQPLVENAILHGLSKKSEKGTLRIVVRRKDKRLVYYVVDDGRGITAGQSPNASNDAHAIPMLKGRLKAFYGPSAGLRIRSKAGKGTLVCLWTPVAVGTA